MKMKPISLDDKENYWTVLALESYLKVVKDDKEDPGPSLMDAMYVTELIRKFREHRFEVES